MIYNVTSSDTNNYETVSIKINVPWNCSDIKFYVKSINTYSNFYVTTTDDFIKYSIGETIKTFNFSNKSSYDIDSLDSDIKKLIPDLNCVYTENKLLKFSNESDITIIEASHRVKMLLGLINMELPIKGKEIICKTVPTTTFYNKLFLLCLNQFGMPLCNKNKGNSDVSMDYNYPNICYVIDTFLRDGLPIILTKKQMTIEVPFYDLKFLNLQLVDQFYEPIILKSPLSVTLMFKPGDKIY